MKKIGLSFLFAALGGIVGSIIAIQWLWASPYSHRLRVQELLLTNDQGEVVARLYAGSEGAILAFFDPDTHNTALEIGVKEKGRFLRFSSPDNKHVVGIESWPPEGAATLYLGDSTMGTRILLGAFRSDVDQTADLSTPIEEWGLQLRDPIRRRALVQLLTKPTIQSNEYVGSIRVLDRSTER